MLNFDFELREQHVTLLQKHNKAGLKYGTSGFRANAELLSFVAWRLGIYVANKSSPQIYGVIITASHNPVQDNGFKIVPPLGGMLPLEEEKLIQEFYESQKVAHIENSAATVWVARDTRPSSQALSDLIIKGIEATGAKAVDLGVLTTPQFQFLVMNKNSKTEFADPTTYVMYFAGIFRNLCKARLGTLVVDCANGVGGIWLKEFAKNLQGTLDIETINDGAQSEFLNDGCGSEFLQNKRRVPRNFKEIQGARYAAVDGDADRLLYFEPSANGECLIVEGDRFAILFAKFVSEHLKRGKIGIIQTAYANGASTKYIKEVLKLEARYEPTGVKYLHHAAHEYDIGIYFEANGHGAVLVNSKIEGDEELEGFLSLSNQAVGDAIANLLMTEYLLKFYGMTTKEWLNMYADYPSLATKLAVRNKHIIKTNYDETQLLEPQDLMAKIAELMSKYPKDYRVLVRPSGTEDVVRVLSEGPEQEVVAKINDEVIVLLREYMELL